MAVKNGELHKGKFEAKVEYEDYDITDCISSAAEMMAKDGCVYVRTDTREFTFSTTLAILKEAFAGWNVTTTRQPFMRSTQTALFGDTEPKPGEVDIVLIAPR